MTPSSSTGTIPVSKSPTAPHRKSPNILPGHQDLDSAQSQVYGICPPGMVKLRMDRRLQGRLDASDVLQEAYLDVAKRAAEYRENPKMPVFLWLRLITGQRLMALHRQHLGAQMRMRARRSRCTAVPCRRPARSRSPPCS